MKEPTCRSWESTFIKFVMVEVMVYIVLGAAMEVFIGDPFLISLILAIAANIYWETLSCLRRLAIQWHSK
ncbi:hypothetical protein SAMN04488137_3872 [Fictibacillus solisalsi]|uniref:Uncharacterized protein n=1 Tax=Fictibacillus solisalsi TaxID=459525 RepID=A0A1H0A2E8_9BACL|nr:hypothetical protein SAMN04488137_3872 [Fictibacillus solisalsi]